MKPTARHNFSRKKFRFPRAAALKGRKTKEALSIWKIQINSRSQEKKREKWENGKMKRQKNSNMLSIDRRQSYSQDIRKF